MSISSHKAPIIKYQQRNDSEFCTVGENSLVIRRTQPVDSHVIPACQFLLSLPAAVRPLSAATRSTPPLDPRITARSWCSSTLCPLLIGHDRLSVKIARDHATLPPSARCSHPRCERGQSGATTDKNEAVHDCCC